MGPILAALLQGAAGSLGASLFGGDRRSSASGQGGFQQQQFQPIFDLLKKRKKQATQFAPPVTGVDDTSPILDAMGMG